MSDRLAVFNDGRIEQIGAPADVYERPATEFVAGFVGVSNVIERDGKRFTVRPEKIRMLDEDESASSGETAEPGRIRDVVYVGMFTRYVVQLDSGGELSVVRQNLEASSQEALESRAAASVSNGDASTCTRSSPPPRRRKHEGSAQAIHSQGGVLRPPLWRCCRRRGVAVVAGDDGSQSALPDSRWGKGEGALDLVVWEGYAQDEWVKPFDTGDWMQGEALSTGAPPTRWSR